jgi:hypothetical protein
MISLVKRCYNYIYWLYMQYLLNTALYMLEPGERKLFTGVLISTLLTAIYSTYVFLPHQLYTFAQYLGFFQSDMVAAG